MKKNSDYTEIFIGVGSNIDPYENILRAFAYISQRMPVVQSSQFYRNEAIAPAPQPHFVNGVWQANTGLDALDLKKLLLAAEEALGRVRSNNRFAPRPIDLDILLYGNEIIRTDDLNIPAPDIYIYAFVACPLAEIAPERIVPDSGKPLMKIAHSLPHANLLFDEYLSTELQRRIS